MYDFLNLNFSKLNFCSHHQMELELTITQEKHRTCQKEVSSRDQVILKLQSDLDTAQQNYTGSLDEVCNFISTNITTAYLTGQLLMFFVVFWFIHFIAQFDFSQKQHD